MNRPVLPLLTLANTAMLLQEWLGNFWTQVYQDNTLVENIQIGRSLLAAQTYLDALETLDLRDHTRNPVFHRERWMPIVLRRSQRNTGNSAILTTYMDPAPIIGPQAYGSGYKPGAIFQIGGYADYENITHYPVGSTINATYGHVTDNPIKPTVILAAGSDFKLDAGALSFKKDVDPFESGKFTAITVLDEDGNEDSEITLWCSDVLIDRDYVYNHLSYVLGVKVASTDTLADLLANLWALKTSGPVLGLFKAAIHAALGEPYITSDSETVEYITTGDAVQTVVTNLNTYNLNLNATLTVAVGDVLTYGDGMSNAIRIYVNPDVTKLHMCEFGEQQFKADVPYISLSPKQIKRPISSNISFTWELSDLVVAGFDDNLEPLFKFDIKGSDEDVDAFWGEHFNQLTALGITSSDLFADYLTDVQPTMVGQVCGKLYPIEYLLKYILRTNTIFVTVDSGKLVESKAIDINLMREILKTVPVHVFTRISEIKSAEDEYVLPTTDSTLTKTWVVTKTAVCNLKPTPGPSASLGRYTQTPIRIWIPEVR
jgi:hypothetical protein